MRWMAVLICLLPKGHTRMRPIVEPDHAGIGARPAYLANPLSLGKRSTLAASKINLAAVNSAHPGSVGRVDPRSFTPADYPRGQRVDVLTEPAQIGHFFGCQLGLQPGLFSKIIGEGFSPHGMLQLLGFRAARINLM